MPKFYIWERVPQWIYYQKTVTAPTVEAALEMAKDWAELPQPEAGPAFGDAIDGIAVSYEAEPVKVAKAAVLRRAARINSRDN